MADPDAGVSYDVHSMTLVLHLSGPFARNIIITTWVLRHDRLNGQGHGGFSSWWMEGVRGARGGPDQTSRQSC